jgi:heparin binding hemagglutinin HbhA
MTTANTEGDHTSSQTTLSQLRTPLLAALGAGSLAGQAAAGAVAKAKTRVNEGSDVARRNLEGLPADLESLRGRLDPAQLRTLLDQYSDAALKLYRQLAESGEQTWQRLATQPPVQRGLDQLEGSWHATQRRVDHVAADAWVRVVEVLATVTGLARSSGAEAEAAARDAGDTLGAVAREAGEQAAEALADLTPNSEASSQASSEPKSATSSQADEQDKPTRGRKQQASGGRATRASANGRTARKNGGSGGSASGR